MLKKYPLIPASLTSIRVRQLQLFAVLANVGSISEAARQSHVTQPTATAMLQELEKGFGIELFLRGTKGVTLTDQGGRVAKRITLSLRELQWAIEESESTAPSREVLKLGFIPNAMYAGLPKAIALFAEKHPNAQLKLKEFNVPECAAALLQGEIDVAFTLNHSSFTQCDNSEEIILERLGEDRFGAFAPTSMTLPPKHDLTADVLGSLPWILPTYDSSIRQIFDNWFVQNGATPPEPVLELTPMTLAIKMLRVMPCMALLPKRLATLPAYAHLEPIEPMSFEIAARFVYASKRSQWERTAVLNLLGCLRAGDEAGSDVGG